MLYQSYKEETGGFSFYLPDLWENYLERIIKSAQREIEHDEYGVKVQNEHRFIEKTEEEKAEEKSPYLIKARPGLIITKGADDLLILDAKMKRVWGRSYTDLSNEERGTIRADIDECIRILNIGSRGDISRRPETRRGNRRKCPERRVSYKKDQ